MSVNVEDETVDDFILTERRSVEKELCVLPVWEWMQDELKKLIDLNFCYRESCGR